MTLVWWLAGLVAAVALVTWYATAMPGRSHRGPPAPLADPERELSQRLRRHVEVLAGEIGERHLWRPWALEAARQYLADQLGAAGYTVRTHPYQVWGETVINLDAELAGSRRPGAIVLLGAHYDSLLGSPGAGDNASGVAAVLELARLLRDQQPAHTVRFAAFVNEEPPFFFSARMGSLMYARACRQRLERIVAMFSLETIGWYDDRPRSQRYPVPFGWFYPDRGDFIAFVGNLSSARLVCRTVAAFRRQGGFPSEGVAAPGYLPGIFWSDHWAFWRQGYRALMVTDTAPFRYPYYHTPADTPDKLDYERMARVVARLANVVLELATS